MSNTVITKSIYHVVIGMKNFKKKKNAKIE